MSWPAFLALVVDLPAIVSFAQRAGADRGAPQAFTMLDWQAFLDRAGELAKGTKRWGWEQERYTADLAALAGRLHLDDPALKEALGHTRKSEPRWPAFTRLDPDPTFEVVLIHLEAGETIAHHDHPDMTGVLVCASGRLRVTSYDLLPEKPDEDGFLLERVEDRSLRNGEISTLSARVRNIHRVIAESPCDAIDIFTPPYDPIRTKETRWYRLDAASDPVRPGVYRATIRPRTSSKELS